MCAFPAYYRGDLKCQVVVSAKIPPDQQPCDACLTADVWLCLLIPQDPTPVASLVSGVQCESKKAALIWCFEGVLM